MSSNNINVGVDRALAFSKVTPPAVFLMITAGVGIVVQLLSLLGTLLGTGMGLAGMSGTSGVPPEWESVLALFQGGLGIVLGILSIGVGVAIFLGALRMKNLTSYGFAMAAAIMAMVPCVSPCCCLGLPAGIWAIVALVDQNVKASFTA